MAKYLEPLRHLELEGAYNIRDIGGYATSDGRRTRWKTFLRADNLNNLTPGSRLLSSNTACARSLISDPPRASRKSQTSSQTHLSLPTTTTI